MNAADEALLALAAGVELAIFDVDGVMTDGTLVIGPGGEETKNFNVCDGLGLVMLREAGIERAVITGRESAAVSIRMEQLGVEHVFQGRDDKIAAYLSLIAALDIDHSAVCYVGDDLPDIPVMMQVGLPVAVANAHERLLRHARYQTRAAGGAGAVREVCELILRAKDQLDERIAVFETRELRRDTVD